MVQHSTTKTKLSHNFKNLKCQDTVLKLERQGRTVSVVLERKIVPFLYRAAVQLCGALLLVVFVHFLFDIDVALPLTAVFLILCNILITVREEAVLLVHSLGFQVTSKTFLTQKNEFIPWNQVQSIFINEVIIRHKIIHLLTILTNDGETQKLIPLFLELQPRLQHLEIIYRQFKGVNS